MVTLSMEETTVKGDDAAGRPVLGLGRTADAGELLRVEEDAEGEEE